MLKNKERKWHLLPWGKNLFSYSELYQFPVAWANSKQIRKHPMSQAVLSDIKHPRSIPHVSTVFREHYDVRSFQYGLVLLWATVPELQEATLNNTLLPFQHWVRGGRAGLTNSSKNFSFSGLLLLFHCMATSSVSTLPCSQEPRKKKDILKLLPNLCDRRLKSVVGSCPPLPFGKARVTISNLQARILGHDKNVNYLYDASWRINDAFNVVASVCSAIRWPGSTQRIGQPPGAVNWTKLHRP